MDIRYENAGNDIIEIVESVKDENFKNLKKANILTIIDNKRKKVQGTYRQAEIKATNELDKFLTMESIKNGYDFVIILDRALVEEADEEDLKRVIFHELCHAVIENGKPKTVPHEIEGFHRELTYNQDDPDWKYRLTELMHEYYDA